MIIINVLICIAVLIIFRKRKDVYVPFIFGIIVHLLLDIPEGQMPYLWPFVQYDFSPGTHIGLMESIEYFWNMMISKPLVLLSEIIAGIIIILFLIYRYYRKKQNTYILRK